MGCYWFWVRCVILQFFFLLILVKHNSWVKREKLEGLRLEVLFCIVEFVSLITSFMSLILLIVLTISAYLNPSMNALTFFPKTSKL